MVLKGAMMGAKGLTWTLRKAWRRSVRTICPFCRLEVMIQESMKEADKAGQDLLKWGQFKEEKMPIRSLLTVMIQRKIVFEQFYTSINICLNFKLKFI